jgi:hypothetical protein
MTMGMTGHWQRTPARVPAARRSTGLGVRLIGIVAACIATPLDAAPVQLDFATVNQSPWQPGAATILDHQYSLPDPALSASVNLGKLSIDPQGAVLDALGSVIGLPLGDVASLRISPQASFTTALTASYHVNAGSIDLNYPTKVNVILPQEVKAGQAFTIGTHVPGPFDPLSLVSQPIQSIATLAGTGYNQFSTLSSANSLVYTPSAGFKTTFPYAEARVDFGLSAQGGIGVRACFLFICDGANANLGSIDVDQQILEASTISGIRVLDQPVVQFGQPIDIGGFASLTVKPPTLSLDGHLQADQTLADSGHQNIVSMAFNAEQLIPFIGPLLHGAVGPFGYELASVQPTLNLQLYQSMTFTPSLMVYFQFSEPVFYNGQLTYTVALPVGETADIMPTIGNPFQSTTMSVQPTFVLDNEFHNVTGLALSGEIDVDVLSLNAPVDAGPAGSFAFDLGTLDLPPLVDDTFKLSVPPITTDSSTIVRNPDLGIALSVRPALDIAGDPLLDPTGVALYDLFLDALGDHAAGRGTVVRGACNFLSDRTCDSLFVAQSDVFGPDGVDLGRLFCLICLDRSDQFLAQSPLLQGDFGDYFLSPLFDYPTLPSLDEVLAGDPVLAQSQYFQSLSSTSPSLSHADVPEPGTLMLTLAGAAMAAVARRRGARTPLVS